MSSPSALPFFLSLLFLLLLNTSSAIPAQPLLPPSSSSSSSSPTSVIPAFPEQSDVTSSCPLHLSPELFPAVKRTCSPSSSSSPSFRLRCCPALAAWLYSAYAPAALSLHSSSASDLPLLPDDSESCMDSVGKALRSNGVTLTPINATCDVAYCYCGIRLRPLSCPRGLSVTMKQGHWIAKDQNASSLERDCARPTLPGCSRCLRSLHQVKSSAYTNTNATAASTKRTQGHNNGRERDCELMGLTWLLAMNRTKYLPTATKVLRAFMMAPAGKDPTTCSARKGMPMAANSVELAGGVSSTNGAGSVRLGDHGHRIGFLFFMAVMVVASLVMV